MIGFSSPSAFEGQMFPLLWFCHQDFKETGLASGDLLLSSSVSSPKIIA